MVLGQSDFDPRFRQAPIVAGQPPGVLPGQTVSRSLGEGGLSNVRPPSSTETDDVKRQQQEFQQMARDASEAFQSLVISRDNQIRGGGAPGQFFAVLEKEFIEAARIWKSALKLAGKDTSVVDRSLARALDGTPKVPVTRSVLAEGQEETLRQGGNVVSRRKNVKDFAPVASPEEFRPLSRDEKILLNIDPDDSRISAEISRLTGKTRILRDRTPILREEGPPGAFSDKATANRKTKADFQNFTRRALKVRELVQKGGADVIGTAGFLNQLKQAVGPQATAIAKTLGLSSSVESFDFPGIDDSAINARLIKSAILDLAIVKAKAIGLGEGRALSDRDLQLQINTISGGFGDPAQFLANLDQAVVNLAEDLEQNQRTIQQDTVFNVRDLVDLTPFEQRVLEPATPTADPQSVDDIAEGETVTQNGVKFIKRNGEMVPLQ